MRARNGGGSSQRIIEHGRALRSIRLTVEDPCGRQYPAACGLRHYLSDTQLLDLVVSVHLNYP